MIIVWGERLCGRVSHTENQIHVATKFFHVQYIPLIPLQSFIVITPTESDGEFKGVPIPLSWKSVLAAYLRTVLLIGCAAFIFRAFMMFSAEEQTSNSFLGLLNLMVGGFLGLSFWGSYQLMKADKEETYKLSQELRSVGYYV